MINLWLIQQVSICGIKDLFIIQSNKVDLEQTVLTRNKQQIWQGDHHIIQDQSASP